MKKQLYIIGAGTGCEDCLTKRGLQLINSCNRLFSTSERLSKLFSGLRGDIEVCNLSQVEQAVTQCQFQSIGLLVSGDTGFFSIAGNLEQKLSACCDIELVCGISSLQYLCSKLGISYETIKVVSLHGRENNISGALSYNHRIFVLTGGTNKAHNICKSLAEVGLGHIKTTAGENLSMPEERIVTGTVKELSDYIFSHLTVLLFENPDFAKWWQPLYDRDFIRGEIPMTKEEVRAVTISKLAIEPEDIVYDIGAGTGSVAVEMARKAHNGSVYAIEQKEMAIALINMNREKHGAYNLLTVSGEAPAAFSGLPVPDKAFIGGSSRNMEEIVKQLVDMNSKIRLAANVITLESLSDAVRIFEKNGLDTDVVCINIAVSKKVGAYHMMNANNPVYIITGIASDKTCQD